MKCELVNAVLTGVITVIQIGTTSLFYSRTRKLREINWLPKAMMMMATLSTSFMLVWSILKLSNVDGTIFGHFGSAKRINDLVNYCLMFRFVRLQVQLKASVENS